MTEQAKPRRTLTGLRRRARLATLGAATAMIFVTAPAAAQIADPARGRALCENHCMVCHTARVHTRPNRIAITREDVRGIVDHWQREQNLKWSAQDTEDVVEFLGRTRYRFAPGTDRLSKH